MLLDAKGLFSYSLDKENIFHPIPKLPSQYPEYCFNIIESILCTTHVSMSLIFKCTVTYIENETLL